MAVEVVMNDKIGGDEMKPLCDWLKERHLQRDQQIQLALEIS
jgi:hypothetical protein